ncbi:MAG: carbamoyltransferase C-terminal domain-containing protein [Candidatus Kapaibacterium sp.]
MLDAQTTHHDAHAYSVVAFADSHMYNTLEHEPYVIVADGFGTFQETISIYRVDKGEPKLIERIYGYANSLGLMYQFATAFCGMKENQDEYKFLGYESHIKEVLSEAQLLKLLTTIKVESKAFVERLESPHAKCIFPKHLDEFGFSMSSLINIEALKHAKKFTYGPMFERLQQTVFSGEDKIQLTQYNQRVVIGFAVQYILEDVLFYFVSKYKMKNLLTCGGVFYNVKLNNFLLNTISGLYCTNPLNGDQGAAFGLFAKNNPDKQIDYKGLIFGSKSHPAQSVKDLPKTLGQQRYEQTIFLCNESDSEAITEKLNRGEVVNMVRKGHEFGPRALCHTTTLALPTKAHAEYINILNNRNEVMPMAPVMLESCLSYFEANEYNRTVGVDMYMIMTYTLKSNKKEDLEPIAGVIHKHPVSGKYTARPQVVTPRSSPFMYRILREITGGMLINTSYNYHGEPIILTYENALSTHEKQCDKAKELGLPLPYLAIVY